MQRAKDKRYQCIIYDARLSLQLSNNFEKELKQKQIGKFIHLLSSIEVSWLLEMRVRWEGEFSFSKYTKVTQSLV